MYNQFQRMEAADGAHLTKKYYNNVRMILDACFWTYGSGILLIGIHIGVISAIMNANLSADALLKATRIASDETVNTTFKEDLSNCTISSLKDCRLLHNGTWYIEAKNSFYGKLLDYSYFIENGYIVSCKELRDGDVSEDHSLPCAYYVGLSISIGCLLSAALIRIFSYLKPLYATPFNVLGVSASSALFHYSLLAGVFFQGRIKDFEGQIIGDDFIYDRTFSSMRHFYSLALVGWMSVFSQRHFLVTKKSRTAVSTYGHVCDVIARWAPYCSYFPAFFFINWLLSYFITFFPSSLMPACDESCWLTQKTLLLSFAAPIVTLGSFVVNGGIMLKYHEQHLEDPRLKEDFVIFSKLFYAMLFICFLGVAVNCVEIFDFHMLRILFFLISTFEGFVCSVCILGFKFRN